MAKVVNVSVCKEVYEKYCKENGLDPKHKMSKLRFASTLDKDAKVVLEKVEKGEIDLDRIQFIEVDADEKSNEPNQEDYKIGARCILKGIAYIMGAKDKWKDSNPLDELSEKGQASVGFALSENFAKEFMAITECIFKMVALGKVLEPILETAKEKQDSKKENKKDDKKA